MCIYRRAGLKRVGQGTAREMAMCRPREIKAFGKPPRQPLEREQLRTLKHLNATLRYAVLRYAFFLMDTKASDRLGCKLCENAHEARMRRIVFSIAFSR